MKAELGVFTRHRFGSIVNSTLGSAEVAAGEGQGKVGQIIRVFIRDRAHHQSKHENGGKNQPPVSARSGSARIAHDGRQF